MGQRIAISTAGDSPEHHKSSAASYTAPNRLEKTAVQTRTLLEIVGALKDFTAPAASSDFGKTAEPHAEVVKAAVKTTELALAQLDNIIDDMARWNLAPDPLEQVHEKLVENQIAGLQAARKPSNRYLPALAQLQSGKWAAVLPQSGEIIGTGETPGDALRAFDDAFEALTLSAKGKVARGAEIPPDAPPAPPAPPAPEAPKRRRRKPEGGQQA